MTFLADTPEISARFRPAAAAERPPVRSPRFVAPGSVTNGQYGLFEYDVEPGEGPARTFTHVLRGVLHPGRHGRAV